MRMLTVIPELGVGGAEVVAAALTSAAVAAGDEARVASGAGFRVAQVRAAGARHVPVRMTGRSPLSLAHAVARLRALPVPDLVHAHNPKAALVSRLAFGHRAPILATLHGVADDDLPRAVRILRRAADRVVAVSPHLADQLVAHGFPPTHVEVVTNGVDPLPPYPRALARAELDIEPGGVVAVCPARLVDQKRHDLLLAAWAMLPPTSVLLLAGDGPNRDRITRSIARHGLTGRVRLLGERPDMGRLLAAGDLLVLATDWEGLPIAVLEAMAAGLPVVASDVPGIGDELGAAVRLVAPGSASALATGLSDLLADPALRDGLAARGRALVADRFGVDRMLDCYREVYRTMTGAPVALRTGVR